MTEQTEQPVDMADDLDAFEAEFFETKEQSTKEVKEEVDENESDQLAPEEDDTDTEIEVEEETSEEEETETEEESDDDDEEEEEEPKPVKKNRKSAKERIEELVAAKREAERREADLLRRLEAVEARNKETEQKEDRPNVETETKEQAPLPDDLNDKGEEKYPLGEFDPQYIRDLTKFTIEQETKRAREEAEEQVRAEQLSAAQQKLQDAWIEKVDAFEEEVPEIRENISNLTDTFQDLEPTYGEYLASTIMASEYGPQIMNYLSQNIGEAQKIVASGPAAATLALGRLEAKFISPPKQEEKRNSIKKVSKAPNPPEDRSRGRGGKFAVSPDTDDLEAFEREFFK